VTDDAIIREVVYRHPIERVWAALTDPIALGRWFMDSDFAPRLGHRFTFRAAPQPGWSGIVHCEVTAVEPPRRLAYTWDSDPPFVTLVTFTLTPVAGGTRLRLEHTGFAAGGEQGQWLREALGSGWVRMLDETLAALLDEQAANEERADEAR
jgi:uncharacterized protein YndB with AHSA1/START domain